MNDPTINDLLLAIAAGFATLDIKIRTLQSLHDIPDDAFEEQRKAWHRALFATTHRMFYRGLKASLLKKTPAEMDQIWMEKQMGEGADDASPPVP